MKRRLVVGAALATLLVQGTAVAETQQVGDTFHRIARFDRAMTKFVYESDPVQLNTGTHKTLPDWYWVIRVVSVRQGPQGPATHEYCLVFGPDASGPSPARGVMEIRSNTQSPGNQEAAVESGTLYASGPNGYGGTEGGSGVGEGTVFIAIGRAGATPRPDTIAVLDNGKPGTAVRVWPAGIADSAKSRRVTPANHYLDLADVVPDLSAHQVKPINTTPPDDALRRTVFKTVVRVDYAITQLQALGHECPGLRLPVMFDN